MEANTPNAFSSWLTATSFHEAEIPTMWIDRRVCGDGPIEQAACFSGTSTKVIPGRMRQYLHGPVGHFDLDIPSLNGWKSSLKSRWQGKLLTWPWAHKEDERWPILQETCG